jgi:hypothetical protein
VAITKFSGVSPLFLTRAPRLLAPLALVVSMGCDGSTSRKTELGSALPGDAPGAAPSPPSASDAPVTAPECAEGPTLAKPRIWRLTNEQLGNTLRSAFDFEPASLSNLPNEARLDGFANQSSQLRIAPLVAEVYFAIGDEIGEHALQNPGKFGIACAVASLARGSCLDGFIADTGQKLWRRPLSAAEVSRFGELFTTTAAQGAGSAGGVKSVIQALFMSPNTSHRTELGTSKDPGVVTQLTDAELASALSYWLWDSAPDAELMTLAEQGRLRDPGVLEAQAQRLFELRDKAAPAMQHFLEQWLKLENLSGAVKESTVFPMATPEVLGDVRQELQLFTNSVFFDAGADRRFETLFSGSYAFVNERTAPLYGLSGVTGTEMVRRELDPSERRGILTSVPFLWGHSHAQDTNLVGRGAYVRSEVLCHRVKLPPGGVPNPGRFAAPGSTGRQRFGVHSSPACAVCHSLFEGIGFALENYDPIGRYRTLDEGQVIDASGSLPLPSEGNALPGIVFSNFVELVDELIEKPDVYSCFAQQFSSYASGYDLPELDACENQRVAEEFAQSQHSIEQLVLSVASGPSFVDRRN